MLGAVKYGIDGLANALGVDDYHFSFTIVRDEPERPDGAVYVSFLDEEHSDAESRLKLAINLLTYARANVPADSECHDALRGFLDQYADIYLESDSVQALEKE